MLLLYTLCFLTRGDDVLMLYRNQPPNQYKWNGVGGKLLPGENPLAACLREVREETGYTLTTARFAGLLMWSGFEGHADGGLYLFTAPAPPGDPVPGVEGELRWQSRQWVFASPEVVSNIPYFAPLILDGAPPQVYHFDYRAGQIVGHVVRPLPENIGTRINTDERR
jgi:8-oxo-dGTP diphosphatase